MLIKHPSFARVGYQFESFKSLDISIIQIVSYNMINIDTNAPEPSFLKSHEQLTYGDHLFPKFVRLVHTLFNKISSNQR